MHATYKHIVYNHAEISQIMHSMLAQFCQYYSMQKYVATFMITSYVEFTYVCTINPSLLYPLSQDQGTTFWVNQFEPLSHLTQTATRILVASGSKQPPPPPTSSSSSSSSFKSTPRLRPPQRMASDPTDLLAVSRSPAQNILKILKKNTGGGRQRHHRHSPLLCCQARGNCSCGCYCDSSLNILMGGGGSGSTRQLFLPQVVSSRTRKNNTLTIAE